MAAARAHGERSAERREGDDQSKRGALDHMVNFAPNHASVNPAGSVRGAIAARDEVDDDAAVLRRDPHDVAGLRLATQQQLGQGSLDASRDLATDGATAE